MVVRLRWMDNPNIDWSATFALASKIDRVYEIPVDLNQARIINSESALIDDHAKNN